MTKNGVAPVHDDRLIFEFLTLESAQAGLSWYTVLRKCENYRLAFDHFDPEKVARYNEKHIALLLQNSGIIRNKLKILAAINNAARFLEVQKEFESFNHYIWQFVGEKPIINLIETEKDYQAVSKESEKLSADLRQRGFKFVGPTICYAHMQAMGMVNDHALDCFRRSEIIETYS